MILGNNRRMLLIEFLQRKNGSAELRDVVEYIAEKEGNTDRKHRKSVYVSLMQTHLPKLEREGGIVTFRRGTITLLKVPNNVTLYMEVVQKNDISWSVFYAGLSVIFALMAIWFGNVLLLFAAVTYLTVSVIHHKRTYLIARPKERKNIEKSEDNV